jgi:hypothetical protein
MNGQSNPGSADGDGRAGGAPREMIAIIGRRKARDDLAPASSRNA